jgi:membrane fusion protein, heavy metal efflux system
LLLTIRSDDVAGGFDAYRKAVADELLARKQLNRAVDLYAHGAIAEQDLEVAQDTADDAKVTLETATEHLRLLGNDPDKPMGMVDIVAPTTGVITDQEVTNAATVQAYSSPSPFTISDISSVWIVCDVYENDLANVRLGDAAEITLNAYPDRPVQGNVSNIGMILDPSIRTAKVRIEVQNPGILRLGMFAKATFRGQTTEMHTVVPASAVCTCTIAILFSFPRPTKVSPSGGGQWRRAARQHESAGDQIRAQTRAASGYERLVLDHVLAQ